MAILAGVRARTVKLPTATRPVLEVPRPALRFSARSQFGQISMSPLANTAGRTLVDSQAAGGLSMPNC